MAWQALFSHNCETLNVGAGNDKFTSVTVTGTGAQAADAVTFYAGAASFRNLTTNGAGTSYGRKTLALTWGLNSLRHVGGRFMVNDDSSPTTSPADWTISSSSVQHLSVYESGTSKGIFFSQNNPAGATKGKIFTLSNNIDAKYSNTVDGVTAGTWVKFDLYVRVHNTAGYVQLWFDDVKVAEIVDSDTYNAAVYDRLDAGVILKGATTSIGCIWWDALVADDAISPSPPAGYSWFTADVALATPDVNEWTSNTSVGSGAMAVAGGAWVCSTADGATDAYTCEREINPVTSTNTLKLAGDLKVATDADTSTLNPRVGYFYTAALADNIALLVSASTDANRNILLTVNGTTYNGTNLYDFNAAAKAVAVYIYAHATLGKVAVTVGGVEEIGLSGLNTLAAGNIVRVAVGVDNVAGGHNPAGGYDVTWDNIVVDGTAYTGWTTNFGTPLRRCILAPELNLDIPKQARGVVITSAGEWA